MTVFVAVFCCVAQVIGLMRLQSFDCASFVAIQTMVCIAKHSNLCT